MNRKDSALLMAIGAWAARDWQASLLRQWISWDEVEQAIANYRGRNKA